MISFLFGTFVLGVFFVGAALLGMALIPAIISAVWRAVFGR